MSGNTLSRGLKASIESIDNRGDFKTFMQNYAYARGNATPKGPRRDGPADEGFLPPLPSYNRERHTPDPPSSSSNHVINLNGTSSPDRGRPTFGVDLNEQMTRDDVDVPLILKKCCDAIERHGIDSHGLYRVSGTTSKVATLKQKLDKGHSSPSHSVVLQGLKCVALDLDSVDLDSNEWTSDINNVTSVIKMWLRELPNPLITASLQAGFMDAARKLAYFSAVKLAEGYC